MAKIGLLSDSHGRVEATRRGVDTLLSHGAELMIHLGDVGGVEVIDTLAYLESSAGSSRPNSIETYLVFGNTDYDKASLARYARSLGIYVDDPVGCLAVDRDDPHDSSHPTPSERKLTFMHGHDHRAMTQALNQGVRNLCHGHTHHQRNEQVGATRVINPGALCRAAVYSVALLETETDRVTFYQINV